MTIRMDRVAEQIHDQIGSLFQGGRLDDPRLEHTTISHVKVSPDLQVATVYFRLIHGDCDQERLDKVVAGLKAASGLFRKRIGAAIKLKRVPSLRFFYDQTLERANGIEALLQQL